MQTVDCKGKIEDIVVRNIKFANSPSVENLELTTHA